MRKFLHVIPLVSAVLALTSFLSVRREPAPDSDGHVLTSLWKEYAKASDADRPKKEAEILLRIKEQALAGHLMWDYYDAARKYVQVSSRRDWKLREKLEKELEQEVVGNFRLDIDKPRAKVRKADGRRTAFSASVDGI